MKMAITTGNEPAVLAWDTEFWGVKIAEADHPDVDRWAVENTVGCVCLLVDASDTERIQDAEERGFRFMDIRVTLERPTHRSVDVATRVATRDDLDSLAYIARSAHRITRFYADPRLDDARCDDLYEGWIRNTFDGWGHVLALGDIGEPIGYVTVHLDGATSSIGLIAVDKNERGNGKGRLLVDGALSFAAADGATSMSVVTQGRNIPALRLFERTGFRVTRTKVWMHKWT